MSDEGNDVLVDDNSAIKVEILESSKREDEIISANNEQQQQQGRANLWGYLHSYSYSV
jgi:hypothetical protein